MILYSSFKVLVLCVATLHKSHFIPQGYQTVLGERGVTVSGGQKQRCVVFKTLMNIKQKVSVSFLRFLRRSCQMSDSWVKLFFKIILFVCFLLGLQLPGHF